MSEGQSWKPSGSSGDMFISNSGNTLETDTPMSEPPWPANLANLRRVPSSQSIESFGRVASPARDSLSTQGLFDMEFDMLPAARTPERQNGCSPHRPSLLGASSSSVELKDVPAARLRNVTPNGRMTLPPRAAGCSRQLFTELTESSSYETTPIVQEAREGDLWAGGGYSFASNGTAQTSRRMWICGCKADNAADGQPKCARCHLDFNIDGASSDGGMSLL